MKKGISMIDYLKSETRGRRRRLEEALEEIKGIEERLARIAKPNQLQFKIKLVSHWTDHGERNVFITARGSLKSVMGQAITEFKRVNSRSEVQAQYYVFAVLPGKPYEEIGLPESYWGDFTK